MKPRVLIADDDDGVRYLLSEILADRGYEIVEAADGLEAWRLLENDKCDLLITDLKMPGLDGMSLLERAQTLADAPPVIVITAHGSERHAVAAMKLGALDYFAKPFDIEAVQTITERVIDRARAERLAEAQRAELGLARHLVFRSEAMKRVAVMVQRVAPREVSVLIVGPSGTGKERVVDAIVAASARADKSVVRLNCAALPRELAEAELFGHARGAFTSAVRARDGAFREARGGTLFLDEIGELDVLVQGKLLRVLQERVVRPLGDDREVGVDVRLVAATNRDLRAEVAAGRFREDLFYRLGAVTIVVPPLADRREDISPLLDHFLAQFGKRFGLASVSMSARVRRALEAEPWPGNVRELEHRVESMLALSSDGNITGDELFASTGGGDARGEADASLAARDLKARLMAFERHILEDELARAGGNRSEVARRLGIARITLLDKLKRHGL